MESPIEVYLQALGRRLHILAAERAVVLEEMRAHLEERAAHLHAAGMERVTAERAAVTAFGDVRVLARRLNNTHAQVWGAGRFARGLVLGALATWAIWTLGVYPLLAQQTIAILSDSTTPISPTLPISVLIQSTPVADGGFWVFQQAGWPWLLPLLVVFCATPFVWGMRARRWWAPGLAYGLGAWLAVSWFIVILVVTLVQPTLDVPFQAEAQLALLAVPLALLAAGLGHALRWRGRAARVATARGVAA